MANAEEYARWIVENQNKAGTPEFDTVARAYEIMRQQADASPTAGMSRTQLGLAGVGKAMTDLYRGAKQRVGLMSPEEVAETRRLDAPLMSTTAGKVGNVAGNVAMFAPTAMIPGANTLTGASLIGAGAGLLQPSESMQETVLNTALGAGGSVAGQAISNKIGSIVQAGRAATTSGQKAAAAAGKQIGMKLTPGKASGSAPLQKMEAAMAANPMTSGGFDRINNINQTALNRAAAKAIGETADELSTPVLARAEQRIGQVFNSVADKTPVPLDPIAIGGRLKQIAADSDGMLANNADLAANGLWKRLDDFVNNRGGATREQLRKLSSDLGKKAKMEMTTNMGDRALGDALFQAQEVVEDAIEGSLSAAQRAAYQEARGQYRNLMNLTARTNITNPSSGNVSGRGLATNLMRQDRGGFTMGRNTSDMYNAARFYQAFPDIVGNSGTATRSLSAADYLASAPGNLLMRMYLSDPVTAGAALTGTTGGLLARGLNPATKRLAQPAGTASGLLFADRLQQ